jgi:hypothetical protein
MADLRQIAAKLGKHVPQFVTPCASHETCLDVERLLLRYPTVTILCFLASGSVIAVFVVISVLAFLVAAFVI